MQKKEISVFTKFNNLEENTVFLAIKNENIIKYIDLEDNTMIIDMESNIIIRENIDYLFKMDFVNNIITIKMKKTDKSFEKNIKTLDLSRTMRSYSVKYLLIDENIINEYYVKF